MCRNGFLNFSEGARLAAPHDCACVSVSTFYGDGNGSPVCCLRHFAYARVVLSQLVTLKSTAAHATPDTRVVLASPCNTPLFQPSTQGSSPPSFTPPKKQKKNETMYHYADTLGFDLAVVVFVVVVMPLAVFLMQSKKRVARTTALALMFAAVMYVAVFEHYRLHRPEVTELGLKRAIVPEGTYWAFPKSLRLFSHTRLTLSFIYREPCLSTWSSKSRNAFACAGSAFF